MNVSYYSKVYTSTLLLPGVKSTKRIKLFWTWYCLKDFHIGNTCHIDRIPQRIHADLGNEWDYAYRLEPALHLKAFGGNSNKWSGMPKWWLVLAVKKHAVIKSVKYR